AQRRPLAVVAATMPSADCCRPFEADCSSPSPDSRTRPQVSRGKLDNFPRTTAEFTTSALDGYGLRGWLPARPTPHASYPVLVHRLTPLLHAYFRPHLTPTPLRFGMTSPPLGCPWDFHAQVADLVRRTADPA